VLVKANKIIVVVFFYLPHRIWYNISKDFGDYPLF
jgi:hypothetical protein